MFPVDIIVTFRITNSISTHFYNRVMTASFHKFGEYFPGTGDVKDKVSVCR